MFIIIILIRLLWIVIVQIIIIYKNICKHFSPVRRIVVCRTLTRRSCFAEGLRPWRRLLVFWNIHPSQTIIVPSPNAGGVYKILTRFLAPPVLLRSGTHAEINYYYYVRMPSIAVRCLQLWWTAVVVYLQKKRDLSLRIIWIGFVFSTK